MGYWPARTAADLADKRGMLSDELPNRLQQTGQANAREDDEDRGHRIAEQTDLKATS